MVRFIQVATAIVVAAFAAIVFATPASASVSAAAQPAYATDTPQTAKTVTTETINGEVRVTKQPAMKRHSVEDKDRPKAIIGASVFLGLLALMWAGAILLPVPSTVRAGTGTRS